jgi:uncharacterized protein (UPF0218 family)
MNTYPKTVRAVVHVESKVMDLEEEKSFFLEVGDYVEKMHESVLLDKIEIVDQVVVPRRRPTRDDRTETQAKQL